MEEEKSAIHSEYEQERIAYQKLLKDFNMLEASNDDLKEKLNMLRGGIQILIHISLVNPNLSNPSYKYDTFNISLT